VLALVALLVAYTPGARAADKVTLRLGWIMKGEYAFLFVGKEKGLFDKHGIDIDILEGRGSVAAMNAVANKNDTFGYTGGPSYLLSRSKGMPIMMVALMLGKGPQVLLSWPDRAVRKPKDLEGKSIILSPGDAFHALWPAFAAGNGVDRSKVNEVFVGVEARAQTFLLKRADVTPEFVTSAVFPLEERAGTEFVKLFLADLGWDTISNGIFAHEDTIKSNPDLVRRLVAAAQEAFDFTAKNIEVAVDVMAPKLVGQSRIVVRKQVEATVQLAHTRRTVGKPLGWSHPEDWKDSLKLMAAGGHLKPIEIRGVYFYFSNEFIPPR
jgi:NitT/TauT family transport system substrate-binding protein